MEIQKNEKIRDRHLAEETIVLGDEGAYVLLRCTLENCRIIVDTKDNSIGIMNSKLTNCTIEFKRKLKNARLVSCDYIQCVFKGKFEGVDFGRWPQPNPLTKQMDELGDMVDCDFTQATLDLCRFFSVDVSRLKFAQWPQFVVPYNSRLTTHHDQVWAGQLSRFIDLTRSDHPDATAVTGTCNDFMKRYVVTEAELQGALDDIGGVIR